MKQRKIRLERGDTLGGTVPLLLRDRVTADFKTGSIHRRRAESRFGTRRPSYGLSMWTVFSVLLLIALVGALIYGLIFESMVVADLAESAWTFVVDWAGTAF